MQLTAILTLALALTAAASPAKTKTKHTTKNPQPTTKPVERCSSGQRGAFEVKCKLFMQGPVSGGGAYINGFQNDLTSKAFTIDSCINACSATANCCGGNIDIFSAAQSSGGSCRLVLKPASATSCEPDLYTFGNLNSDHFVGFGKTD